MSRESFGEGQWSKVQENIKFCPKRDQLSRTLIIWGYNIRMPLSLKVSQYSLTNVQCPFDWHCAWLLSKGYTSIFNSEQSVEVLRRGAPADWDQLYLPGPLADNLTGRWAQSSRTVDGTRTRVKPGSTLRMSVNPGEPGMGSRRVQLSLAGCTLWLCYSGSTCSIQLQPQLQTEAHSWHIPAHGCQELLFCGKFPGKVDVCKSFNNTVFLFPL